MEKLPPYMTIWEIAHRWHGCNPITSTSKTLPIEVYDRLRWLIELAVTESVHLTSNNGVVIKNATDLPSPDSIGICHPSQNFIINDGFKPYLAKTKNFSSAALLEEYCDYQERFTRRNEKALEPLYKIRLSRAIGKFYVDRAYIYIPDLRQHCIEHSISLPTFFKRFSFKEQDETPTEETKLAHLDHKQRKLLVQGAAVALFHANPKASINSLAEHEVVVNLSKYGNRVISNRTRRTWISEVAPTKDHHAPGRRPKA